MSKQMTDAALRQQVAQWTRTALGQVIEDDRERSAAAPAVERTTCCIVGSGPAGAVLALLLARKGIPVVLLESHSDFDRDFRGDILQASALEIMDELGLTDRLFQLPHTKLPPFAFQMDACSCTQIDLIRLHTRHRYITLLAQADFLEVVTGEAKRYPTFRLVMGAHVERLIEESGAICGVRYRGHDGWHEVRALLTIGADGRFSWVRRLVGWKPIPVAPPTDVFWFRLPHRPDDPETMLCRTSNGRMLIAYNRSEYWQIAYLLPKGAISKRIPQVFKSCGMRL